jgi:hypothetical protein
MQLLVSGNEMFIQRKTLLHQIQLRAYKTDVFQHFFQKDIRIGVKKKHIRYGPDFYIEYKYIVLVIQLTIHSIQIIGILKTRVQPGVGRPSTRFPLRGLTPPSGASPSGIRDQYRPSLVPVLPPGEGLLQPFHYRRQLEPVRGPDVKGWPVTGEAQPPDR